MDSMGQRGRRQFIFDHVVVAELYLAEHPEDDDDTVTEEWLRSVMSDAQKSLELSCNGLTFGVSWYVHKWLCYVRQDDEHVELGEVKTRSDVRDLCRALGVSLDENQTTETHR